MGLGRKCLARLHLTSLFAKVLARMVTRHAWSRAQKCDLRHLWLLSGGVQGPVRGTASRVTLCLTLFEGCSMVCPALLELLQHACLCEVEQIGELEPRQSAARGCADLATGPADRAES